MSCVREECWSQRKYVVVHRKIQKRIRGKEEREREREIFLALPNVSKYSLKSSSELSELKPPTKIRFTYIQERERERERERDDFRNKVS